MITAPCTKKTRFSLPNGEACEVEVVYLQQQPVEAEGPFLAEERNLINMIAEMLRIYFINQTAAEELLAEKSDGLRDEQSAGRILFLRYLGALPPLERTLRKVTGYSGAEIANCHPARVFEGFDRELVNQKIAEVLKKDMRKWKRGIRDPRQTADSLLFHGCFYQHQRDILPVGYWH